MKLVTIVFFAMAVPLIVSGLIYALHLIKRKRRAEEELERELVNRLEHNATLMHIFDVWIKETEAGVVQPKIQREICEAIVEALEHLDKAEREAVLEALFQPSELGRVRYISTLTNDCLSMVKKEHNLILAR